MEIHISEQPHSRAYSLKFLQQFYSNIGIHQMTWANIKLLSYYIG